MDKQDIIRKMLEAGLKAPARGEFIFIHWDQIAMLLEYERADAIREAREHPAQQQKPVAWATRMGEYAHIHWGAKRPEYPMVYEVPLYTSPQPAQRKPWVHATTWRGLTDEELYEVFPAIATYTEANKTLYRSIARAIEAKLKEKNT